MSRPILATDVISRRDPASLRALGKGWSVDVNAESVTGFWAVGKESELHLFTAQEGDHQLAFEVSPPVGAAAQGVSFRLNGEHIDTAVALEPGWKGYQVTLPAELMRIGYNHLSMSFSRPLRPSDTISGDEDERLLSARFLYLRLVPPVARPMVPFGPVDPDPATLAAIADNGTEPIVEPAESGGRDDPGALWRPRLSEDPTGAIVIELPTDSIFDIALELPAGARLVGDYTTELPAESEGQIEWVAELFASDGTIHPLDSGGSHPGWLAGNSLSANLSAWSGQEVLVRLRTWGSDEGVVRWTGLGLRTRSVPVEMRQFEPPPLPIPETSGRLGKPDIVMVLLDAARADVFSTYRGVTTTPVVDALAAEGTRFERAYTAAPWTGQSVHSLLTGRYPEAHGVESWKHKLPGEIRSLFQHTYAAGYHTYLWTEHPLYRGSRSLRYDIDTVVDLRKADRTHRRELLPSAQDMFRDDRPTFALVHLVPPHAPYEAPEPFGGIYSEWYQGDFSADPGDLQRFSKSVGLGHPSEQDVLYVQSLYHENVQYADLLLGDIIETLKRAGRYDKAMIVLLSDHGEAFYEHGYFLHTWPMYEEMMHVPLVIKWPATATEYSRVVETPVSLIDLAPTILDGIGVDSEPYAYQGYSLLPTVFDNFVPTRDLYASTIGVSLARGEEAPQQPMAVLIHDDYKVIFDEVSGRVELYDLSADPDEREDLAHMRPVVAQRMVQRLLRQQAANRLVLGGLEVLTQSEEELDPEMIEHLRDLGYIQ